MGDVTLNTEFQNLSSEFCLKAIEVLVKAKKAELFSGSDNIDETGFKFIRLKI